MKLFKRHLSFLDWLDNKCHGWHKKHFIPKFVLTYFCDAFEYQVSGGQMGCQNWPLNLHKGMLDDGTDTKGKKGISTTS